MNDPDLVRDRWLQLQAEGVDALKEQCLAAAVTERTAEFSWWAYHPRPFPRELAGQDPRQGGSGSDARLGMDAQGRVVFQILRDDLFLLYEWVGDRCDMIEFNGAVSKLERFVFVAGRLAEEIAIDGGMVRLDGRPAVGVTRWFYDGERPVRVVETYESGSHQSWGGPERGPYWKAKAHEFAYLDGELETITTFLSRDGFADGGDVAKAQAEALARFPQGYDGPRPLYEARTHRQEPDLPDPEHAFEGIAAPLADALFAAIEARRTGPLEFVLVVAGGTRTRAIAADGTFIARAQRMTRDLRELLQVAYQAPRGTVLVEASEVAPPEVLRELRAGEQALVSDYGSTRPAAFQDELVSALSAQGWKDVAPTFVVLASLQEPHGPQLDPFIARLKPGWTTPSGGPLRSETRDELTALLLEAGLSPEEAARVSADALWGILLEGGGTGLSRLGGAPVLAVDQPWPHAEDRPLTHLATIALAELPAVEGREHLPADGFLSFFVDLSEEGEFVEPIEPADETGHELVAIMFTPADSPTHEPEPPDEELDEVRVTPTARLQLRHLGFGYGQRLFGLDALAEHAVERLIERVNGDARNQLLGYPWPVQDEPREPGQIVLFHVADDYELGFGLDFMDAGDIHFLGTPEDIRARRWDQLTVWPNSC